MIVDIENAMNVIENIQRRYAEHGEDEAVMALDAAMKALWNIAERG